MAKNVEIKMHYKKWRQNERAIIEDKLKDYPYIIIVNLKTLPAKAEREFRALLVNNGCFVKVANSNVIKHALHNNKITNLDDYLNGPTMLAFSKENPFKIYKEIKKNASAAFAKEGMIAPDDIYIPEGDTGIAPGPALTDFKLAKIDTQIRAGKIYVSKKTLVCKKGDPVDSKAVVLLTKLNIKPMKVILDIRKVLDKKDNILYSKDNIDINLEDVMNKIKNAYQNSFFLALSQEYITKQTIKPLLIKGYKNTKAIALSKNILNKNTAKDILIKAHKIANNLNKKTSI